MTQLYVKTIKEYVLKIRIVILRFKFLSFIDTSYYYR